MNPLAVGLTMVGVFLATLSGILLWGDHKKKMAAEALAAARARAPKVWLHVGRPPPPDVYTALSVIGEAMHAMPQAGTIEWVNEPYMLDGFGRVAGHVVSFDPVVVKVAYAEKVEETALAHELTHVDDYYRLGRAACPRESPGDKDFVAFFTAVNADIKKALGR
jgi:hypothetical protein